jgi:hypothetical protein
MLEPGQRLLEAQRRQRSWAMFPGTAADSQVTYEFDGMSILVSLPNMLFATEDGC